MRQIKVKFDESLSAYRGRKYYLCEETGRYFTQIDGEWLTCTDNYWLEPDCHVADDVEVVVVPAVKEYYGGDDVCSRKHGRISCTNESADTTMEIWYRADFDLVGLGDMTDEYHCVTVELPITKEKMEQADKEAIEWAKNYAKEGKYFADAGDVELDLVELHEVDGKKECFPDIRCVWS